MAFEMDQLLRKLGTPGKYQMLIFALLFFNYFQVAFNHVCMAFFGATPPGISCTDQRSDYINRSTTIDSCSFLDLQQNRTHRCTKWEYSGFEEREWTIVTEWDLVCDDKDLGPLATTIYFVGVMVGGILFGFLADAFGRLPMLILTMYGGVAIGIALYFVPSYNWFTGLRFVQGILIQGLQITTVTLLMEFSLPRYRTLVGCILEVYWGLGVCMLALIGLAARNWKWMQLAITLPSVLTILYIWFIPESLRWLLCKQKFKRAKNLVTRIIKFNKIANPETVHSIIQEQVVTHHKHEHDMKKGHPDKNKTYTLLDLFRTRILRIRSLILFYIWFSVSLGYYGLVFSSSALAGNKYLNFSIGALLELCAYVFALFILYKFGRRLPLMSYFLAGGIACIVAGAIPKETEDGTDLRKVKTGLSLFGRFGLAGAFSVVFLYTSELYPTVMRSVGIGACTFWTRFGGVLAPQINRLSEYTFNGVPPIIFGVLAIIAGFLTLLLPETLNRNLPETIADAEALTGSSIAHDKSDDKSDDKSNDKLDDKSGIQATTEYSPAGNVASRDTQL